jgi:hypothetical protein
VQVLRLVIMRYVCPAAVVALSILVSSLMWGQASAPALVLTDATVGQNLEGFATVSLTGPIPKAGLQITITSNDPSKLLLSITPDGAGSPSIVVNVQPGIREPEFFLQGLGKSGTVTYTATAPGVANGTGKVTLAPSGIVVAGPYGIGKNSFLTTTGATKPKITVYSVLLDSSLNYVAKQPVVGGRPVTATLTSSNSAVGTIAPSTVKIAGGSSSATALFQPAGEGETTVAVTVPHSFSTPAQFTAVTAKVSTPGLSVSEDLFIGQNLEAGGSLSLGEAAPAGGVTVTLTCNDPDKLLLSPTATDKGSGVLTIKVPPGGIHGTYYMQALSGGGPVTYTATAPGYRTRTAKITLTASGVVVAGPLSFTRAGGSPGFVAKISSGQATPILVYTAYLDPVTHRSADVTVQPLRAGVSLTIALTSSDPSVGAVASPVTIKAASDTAETRFTPLKPGTTMVSVVTPEGYTPSSNATVLKAIVTQ